MPDVSGFFRDLKRVRIEDVRRPKGWSDEEVGDLALKEAESGKSCLVVVNTKKSALEIYRHWKTMESPFPVFHLSTGMCPAHRKQVLRVIRRFLEKRKAFLCVSTQLIEAGVDVDFDTVVRFLAGLDSIAQAAGRCNRNKRMETGFVYVVNPASENLDKLPDIRIGVETAERLLDAYRIAPERFGGDVIGPEAMAWYYRYYFFKRQNEMAYFIKGDGSTDHTLLNLLSTNDFGMEEYKRINGRRTTLDFRQAFMTAAKAFQAIDAPTQGVLVPYKRRGARLIQELREATSVQKRQELMKEAQQYSVNLFPHEIRKLQEVDGLDPIGETGITSLYRRHYGNEFGFCLTPCGEMEIYIVSP